MQSLSFKGIIAGVLLVLLLDTIGAIVLHSFSRAKTQGKQSTVGQTSDRRAQILESPQLLLISFVLGTLATLAGGYCAARIARRDPYLNAGILGALGVAFGAAVAGNYPLWFNLLGFLTTLLFSLAGGHIAKRQMERNA